MYSICYKVQKKRDKCGNAVSLGMVDRFPFINGGWL